LTHKLYKKKSESVTLRTNRLHLGENDGILNDDDNGYVVSDPIELSAGQSAILKANISNIGRVHSPLYYWQAIYLCDSTFEVGEHCTLAVKTQINGAEIKYTAESDCILIVVSNYWNGVNLASLRIEDYDQYDIDEPIGFDGLRMHIERNDYHGMGAEVSLDSLEFYGIAYNVIKQSYESNIDQELLYRILDESGNAIYSGSIDLTTCNFNANEYASVKAKIGEIGVCTIFNNRTSTEIDVNKSDSVGGVAFDTPDWLSMVIPMRHLLYTNKSRQTTVETIDFAGGGPGTYSGGIQISPSFKYVFLPIGNSTINEYGTFAQVSPYVVSDIESIAPQYYADEDHAAKYGNDTIVNIDIKFSAEAYVMAFSTPGESVNLTYKLVAVDGDGHSIEGEEISKTYFKEQWLDFDCKLKGSLPAGGNIKFYLQIDANFVVAFKLKLFTDTYSSFLLYDNLAEVQTKADMILVHDALNVVSHAITDGKMAVKSEWYRTPESKWNPGSVGGGACKALTNGYHIRGLFTNGEYERNMPLSFKSLIESLDAMDCIGWGFSTELENNVPVTCIRVERWDWFYKDSTILTLTDVAEVNTDIYTDRIPTELKIGYKKYATQEQYNSIDSPHGTRTFTSGIMALSKTITKESDFIADNYAIEEIRRAKSQVNETEETTYDENIFVFELLRALDNPQYEVGHTAYDATNVGCADEFINAKLTPRHMAARWRPFLFSTNNTTPFRFTSGEINYKSSFSVYSQYAYGKVGLAQYDGTSGMAENKDIDYIHAKFQAEKITFSCPISVEQYKAIKANPYGLVSVNGILGWIMDFKYKFEDGMADFTLLAKYVPQNN